MDRYLFDTLSCYVLRKILFSFSVFLAISSSILVFVSFIQYSDIFIAAGVTFSNILKVLLMMFPLSVELALPVSFMASLFYVVYVMNVKNEILSVELTGNSRFVISRPVILFALFVFFLNLVFSVFVFPMSIGSLKNMATGFAGNNIRNTLSENRINDDIPDTVIFFKKKELPDRYKNLFVFQKKDDGNNLFLFARDAVLGFGKESLSIDIIMNSGSIIERENDLLRYIEFVRGNMTLDISDIIEKKIKNIRGFYQSGVKREKSIFVYDGIYLSSVNLWIAVLVLLIFLKESSFRFFVRYLLLFLLTAFYYTGFRFYHSLFESGLLSPGYSFVSVLLLLTLTLIIVNRTLLKR